MIHESNIFGDLLQQFIFTSDTTPGSDGKIIQGLPHADIQRPYIVGPEISGHILSMYRYPCRLKAGIFVITLEGKADMSINIGRHQIGANHFVCITPGSIIQCHSYSDDLRLCFIAFSSEVIKNEQIQKPALEFFPRMKEQPVLPLRPEASQWFREYFNLLAKAHLLHPGGLPLEITVNILLSVFYGVKYLYQLYPDKPDTLSRSDEIYKELQRLLKENYTKERGVAFYASRLGISPQHLSMVIRQVSGQTVSDIIAAMVIIDAKAQLKSTRLKMKEIAASLNFPNLSYFGKYFKRHTGMSPQEYRDKK